MAPFERPPIVFDEYRDDDGVVIPYGARWPGSPAEDSYSRETNLDRFAPVPADAAALIDWLAATFDADVSEDPAHVADLVHAPWDPSRVTRVVRVTPTDPDAAPLTFVFTAHPTVTVHAGAVTDLRFPVCACDACDESPALLLDELEQDVFAVVSGGFTERLGADAPAFNPPGRDPLAVTTWFERPNGGAHGGSDFHDLSPERRAAVEAILAGRTRWAAWPVR